MDLLEVEKIVKEATPHELLSTREAEDHIFINLGFRLKNGMTIPYVFAISRVQLREAPDPKALILEHLAIAASDLALVPRDGLAPPSFPEWDE